MGERMHELQGGYEMGLDNFDAFLKYNDFNDMIRKKVTL